MEIKPGIYRHYKGNLYRVIGVGTHSDTSEKTVIYQGLYDDPELGHYPLFSRSYKVFIEAVEWEGKIMQRFLYVKEEVYDKVKKEF